MVRLQVVLDSTEADVLAQWAASELRDPRDQIRFVLRQELERRGLLEPRQAVGLGASPGDEAGDNLTEYRDCGKISIQSHSSGVESPPRRSTDTALAAHTRQGHKSGSPESTEPRRKER